MKTFVLGMILLGMSISSCSGGGGSPTPTLVVPTELVQKLIAGSAPSPMNRNTTNCIVEPSSPDLWYARCGQDIFLVSTRSANVTPGDETTKRRWDTYKRISAPAFQPQSFPTAYQPPAPTPLSRLDIESIVRDQAYEACQRARKPSDPYCYR